MSEAINFVVQVPASDEEILLLAVVRVNGKWAVAQTTASRQVFEHVEISLAGGLLLGDLREAIKQLEHTNQHTGDNHHE
jgi:hypothetical protein